MHTTGAYHGKTTPSQSLLGLLRAKVALAAIRGNKTRVELPEHFDEHANQITQWKQHCWNVRPRPSPRPACWAQNDDWPCTLFACDQTDDCVRDQAAAAFIISHAPSASVTGCWWIGSTDCIYFQFYNQRRPASRLDRQTPDQVYFTSLWLQEAA